MNDEEKKPVYCPQCREFVAPIMAAVKWYCPHCVWQFSQADIDHCEQWKPEKGKGGEPLAS